MTDIASALAALRRPRLLIRAARFGQAGYDSARDLRRVLRGQTPARGAALLDQLMEEEARHEETRLTGAAHYRVARHVEVLIALVAEARAQMDGPAAQAG